MLFFMLTGLIRLCDDVKRHFYEYFERCCFLNRYAKENGKGLRPIATLLTSP